MSINFSDNDLFLPIDRSEYIRSTMFVYKDSLLKSIHYIGVTNLVIQSQS